jgi:serralysin
VTIYVYGNNSSNVIEVPEWDDENHVIYGYAGNDLLIGAYGADTIYGGSGNDSLYGEAGNDYLSGGSGHDNLYGGTGHDILSGGSGYDKLLGGSGNDDLYGGTGKDTLTGGTGADYFVFTSLNDSNSYYGRDTITDFNYAQGDTIDLSAIDAKSGYSGNNSFNVWGDYDSEFSGLQGELHYFHLNGFTVVEGDTNGDTVADIQIYLSGTKWLEQSDFVI